MAAPVPPTAIQLLASEENERFTAAWNINGIPACYIWYGGGLPIIAHRESLGGYQPQRSISPAIQTGIIRKGLAFMKANERISLPSRRFDALDLRRRAGRLMKWNAYALLTCSVRKQQRREQTTGIDFYSLHMRNRYLEMRDRRSRPTLRKYICKRRATMAAPRALGTLATGCRL